MIRATGGVEHDSPDALLSSSHLLPDSGPVGASVLLGYRGRIYEIDGTVNAVAVGGRYHAAGSGEDPALGASHALAALGELDTDPERAVQMALAAAEAHRIYVEPPFTILHMGVLDHAAGGPERRRAGR